MTTEEVGRRVSELLFKAGAVHCNLSQPYMLAGGWASPVYIDVRLLFGEHSIRNQLVNLVNDYLVAHFSTDAFDAVAGAETAGIPLSVSLADRNSLDLRYVRKRSLGIGRDAQVEGGSVDGLRVLLVDDMTTDGSSKLNFARGLRAAGAHLEHVLCVFFHDAFPGARDRLAEAGLKLHALAGWNDLLRADSSTLHGHERAEIERFLADPVAWSARHGGRVSASSRW